MTLVLLLNQNVFIFANMVEAFRAKAIESLIELFRVVDTGGEVAGKFDSHDPVTFHKSMHFRDGVGQSLAGGVDIGTNLRDGRVVWRFVFGEFGKWFRDQGLPLFIQLIPPDCG